MNTASQPQAQVAATEEKPVLSFTRVIEGAPTSARFGGWGPKVVGASSLITRWN